MGESLKGIIDTIIQEYSTYLSNANREIYLGNGVNIKYEVIGLSSQSEYNTEEADHVKIAIEELLKNAIEAMSLVRINYIKQGIKSLINSSLVNITQALCIPGDIVVNLIFGETTELSIEDHGCGLPPNYENLPFDRWESTFKGVKPGNKGVRLAYSNLSSMGISLHYQRRTDGTTTTVSFPP